MIAKSTQNHINSWSDFVGHDCAGPFAGEFEKRAALYKQEIAEEPENPELWVQFGNLCRRHGHIREMVTAYAKAIHLYALGNQTDRAVSLSRVLATADAYDIRSRAAERAAQRDADIIPLR